MTHWLTAISVSITLSLLAGYPSQAAELPAPELKISYAMGDAPADEAAAPADIWVRIRAGFKLPEANSALTQTHARWFADRPEHFARVVARSRPYLYHIVEEVEKRNMPMEIALLPIIESAFNPEAISPARAAGIWQFIPSTGKVYGLKQNGWYDGRRDVMEATKAALDYLQTLHGMFGDWELALAAYNCGEGCVGRALKRNGGGGFASLKLPTETQHYVPKLEAVRNIIKDPSAYGMQLASIPDDPYFLPVALKRPIEARTAAKLAEMSLEDFSSLNPGFQRRVIHTDTRAVLLLPADRVQTFQFNLHRQGMDKGTLQTYAAKKGESVASIADRFNVTIDWLKDHNPISLWRGKVKTQQDLIVPKSGTSVAVVTAPLTASSSVESPAQTVEKPVSVRQTSSKTSNQASRQSSRKHTVKKGETLAKLARQYKVKVADIKRLNKQLVALKDRIKPGMELEIPARSAG